MSLCVVHDQLVCSLQDPIRRTIVLRQRDELGTWEMTVEFEDVTRFSAAPAID